METLKAQKEQKIQPKKNNSSFFKPVIQKKLSVGSANDAYELEADRVADKVMKMPEPASPITHSGALIQRKCAHCEQEEKLQMKPLAETISPLIQRSSPENGGESHAPNHVENQINSSKGSGSSMDSGTKNFMENRFGTDFSNVKIHIGSEAVQMSRELNAQAFAVGNDIYFNEGKYSPNSNSGKHLLAHELTHTVQQNGGVGRKVQKLDCDTAHIERECNGAANTCQSVAGYCSSNYPDTNAMNTLYSNAIAGAVAQAAAYPQAAVNLNHFLDGTGTELTMGSAIFISEPETNTALNRHRQRFIDGATRRLGDGRLTPGGTVDMVFTNTANAFSIFNRTDLGIAVGGYTICSKVTVSAVALGGDRFTLHFTNWSVQAFDCYNWDPGKGIGVPGATDNDLCCLENAGRARHFKINTPVWNNTNVVSMADATVTATLPSSTSPSPSPSPTTQSSGGGGVIGWINSLFR
ncbi:DUF4157 domain-containing protein [Chryseobacterium aahli]|uniref:eCIS core domain-containing protein n=1 Tax=Chryseobacterium aahli TaxID=1278643 RepID=UPI001F604CF2|nr:DUF4157 domain-containing protein [Chryseobacterium aahli]MCI3939201.1 DUF4157 domain-containing protein [Chryseobacterium aahli]